MRREAEGEGWIVLVVPGSWRESGNGSAVVFCGGESVLEEVL